MAGTFGYELDFHRLSVEEKDEVRRQIADYHKYGPLIMNGLYYRLTNPYKEIAGAWEFVSEDGTEVFANIVMQEVHGNAPFTYIRLKGLLSGRQYAEQKSGKVYDADALMEAGIPIPVEMGEYQAYQYYFKCL